MGSLENRISRLEGRLGTTEGATTAGTRVVEKLAATFEDYLQRWSPRIESPEFSIRELEGQSPMAQAVAVVTLRYHGDPREQEVRDMLERNLADPRRRELGAGPASLIYKLIDHYTQISEEGRRGA